MKSSFSPEQVSLLHWQADSANQHQLRILGSMLKFEGFTCVQLMDSKAAELEGLLAQLSDVNDGMRSALGGRNDTRTHTLTRHRDILHDYQQVCIPESCTIGSSFRSNGHVVISTEGGEVCKQQRSASAVVSRTFCQCLLQEFRRHNSSFGASRDRLQLLRGSSDKSPLVAGQNHNASGALLRERGQISGAHAAVSLHASSALRWHKKQMMGAPCHMQLDDVMGTATAVAGRVDEQSKLFENIGNKVLAVGAKFPAINGILNAVRRKKSKVRFQLFGSWDLHSSA